MQKLSEVNDELAEVFCNAEALDAIEMDDVIEYYAIPLCACEVKGMRINMNLFYELFNNNTLYFDCFNRLPEAIYVYNAREELVFMNKAAELLDGFTLDEGKGKPIFELYDYIHGDKKYSPILLTLETEQPLCYHEHSYYSNGMKRMQVCNTAPIYYNGELVGAFQIQEDRSNFKDIVKDNNSVHYEIVYQKSNPSEEKVLSSLIGHSDVFTECKEIAKRAAKTDSSVMLVGSTGSGKEVFARAIHDSSRRSKGTFLALNCAAIPESLFEGILFGTTKGVYTGASEKEGLLAQAAGGTIFLDEINSMPLTCQAKILRVLEERKIMKLGSDREQGIDIRIVSSTNEVPQEAIANGHIREDLFYRLSVVQLVIPLLRDRKEDIPELVQYFIDKYNNQFQKNVVGVDNEVMEYFMKFSWPGNVRQLKACIESAMNFVEDNGWITFSDLPQYVFESSDRPDRYQRSQQMSKKLSNSSPDIPDISETKGNKTTPPHMQLRNLIWQEEKNEIMQAMQQSKGNISKAAKLLGISKQLLFYRMKKYNLK